MNFSHKVWTRLSSCLPRLRELLLTARVIGTISDPDFFRDTLPEAFPRLETLNMDGHDISLATCLLMVTRFVRAGLAVNLRKCVCDSRNKDSDEEVEAVHLAALRANERFRVFSSRDERRRFFFAFLVE